MRKGVIALAVAVVVSLSFMASYLYCQDNAPKISNLVFEGEKEGVVTLKVGADRDLIFTFECNQRPDTVYLRNFGAMGPRTINKVYSSPEDVKVKITEKDGAFSECASCPNNSNSESPGLVRSLCVGGSRQAKEQRG